MVFENDTIFYFTGTGNSLQVAKDIADQLSGINVCALASIMQEDSIIINAKSVGFVFPIYFSRIPLLVEKFIEKLTIRSNPYIFAVVTYGGAPSDAIHKLNRLLQKQSINLSSGFMMRMPANHIMAYNPSKAGMDNKIFRKERLKVKRIADVVRQRRRCKFESSKLRFDIAIDRIFTKQTDKIMENFHDRDKYFWVTDRCNGCNLCERICPVKNIECHSGEPAWKHSCEQCSACIQYCPRQAIEWGTKTAKRGRYQNPYIKVNELLHS
jgi:Pyruvate/2-oxoacid:ferredoxin oxidoreductase delta subunit